LLGRVTPTFARRLAAILGFLAVVLGAFGAHALKGHLMTTGTDSMWNKAVLYQLAHTLVLLMLSQRTRVPSGPAWCFVVGILLFSGTLYAFAAWRLGWLMYFTPLGGVAFLAGWLWLALLPARTESAG
jgi:uncharacterized membrane protein YgdD (TMEM256/DUF423 family)